MNSNEQSIDYYSYLAEKVRLNNSDQEKYIKMIFLLTSYRDYNDEFIEYLNKLSLSDELRNACNKWQQDSSEVDSEYSEYFIRKLDKKLSGELPTIESDEMVIFTGEGNGGKSVWVKMLYKALIRIKNYELSDVSGLLLLF